MNQKKEKEKKKSELTQVEGAKKGRGRPKITLVEVIKKRMSIRVVIESMNLNRVEWRKKIHVADPILFVWVLFVEDP